jgi:DNA-binding Xre family transcriptional regulator
MSKKAKKSTVDLIAIDNLSKQLIDEEDPEIISMEGIAKLCEMLEIDPSSDIRSLALVWRLGAVAKPGQISVSEFKAGMEKLGLSDIRGLKNHLPALDPGFLDRSEFRGVLI